ncbi:Lrp/AsnC ligand binding domain-containing protein [Natrialbaceae archaeon A-arb3/5]
MVYAYTLIDAATGLAEDVRQTVSEVEGVADAHVIAGDFDVIVELESDDPHGLLTIVTADIRPVEGVGTTRTYVCLD